MPFYQDPDLWDDVMHGIPVSDKKAARAWMKRLETRRKSGAEEEPEEAKKPKKQAKKGHPKAIKKTKKQHH